MDPTDSPAGRPEIDGREAAQGAWQALLLALPEAAPRELWVVDAEGSDWPWELPEIIAALTRWARLPGRRMRWLCQDYAGLVGSQPRLNAWRRDFAHVVQAWAPAAGERLDWPCWLMNERCALVLDDRPHWRGRRVIMADELRALREGFEQLLQRCEPAWPAYQIGL